MNASQIGFFVLFANACAVISQSDHDVRLDEDNDGFPMGEDCDDQDRSVQIPAWNIDSDGDGYGTQELMYACTQPLNTATNALDCNDEDPAISPDGVEICDEIDNNCNDAVDDSPEDALLRFRDLDGDGYGNSDIWMGLCEEGTGWVEDNTDCNDSESSIHPGAIEICGNNQDDDCDNDPGDCFLSGSFVASDADLRIVGAVEDDGLSESFAWAGDWDDVPGDELWIGVTGYDEPRNNNGIAFIFGGQQDGTIVAEPESAFNHSGDNQGERMGSSVLALRDMDGDGRTELLVQNPGSKSVVLLLSDEPTDEWSLEAAMEIRQSGASDQFGETLSALPDWDGDSIDEIVVGVPRYDGETSGTGSGAIAILASEFWSTQTFGSEFFFEDTAHTIITGQSAGDHFGESLDQVGDTNGDGIPELAVGAPEQNEEGSSQGAVFIIQPQWHLQGIYGADALSTPILGSQPFDRFGSSVAGVGDTNGDGYDDVLIGSPDADYNGRKTGAAMLYLGPIADSPDHYDHTARLTATQDKAALGEQVSSAGDINLDGLPDLAVSAPGTHTADHDNAGAVYLFLSPNLHNKDGDDADTIIYGDVADQNLGHTLAGAGFYNDDDRPDLAIGAMTDASFSATDKPKNGALLLFFGRGH